MARVPDEELEWLKQDTDLADLARELGVKLRWQGKNLVGLCPFHDDHQPSLVITPRKNLWSCLGACQTGGSVIDWVMKLHRCNFREAVEILRRRNGQPIANEATTRRSKPPLSLDVTDEQMMHEVLDYYHATLTQHLSSQEYLKQRGISAGAAISQFRLGFCDRTLGKQLPLKQSSAGRSLRAQLQRLGILRSTGHEAFRGSLVIPVFDEQGRVTEIYGRKTTRALRKDPTRKAPPFTTLHLSSP